MKDLLMSPILVTGCARSGSSMIAGVLNICGAFGGIMSGADREKGRGVNENDKIYNRVVVPYMESIKADVFGQFPLPHINKMPIPTDWKKNILDCLAADGYTNGSWMYKSSKSCLLWPIWEYAFPNARWVIVRRRTGDVIQSCLNTTYMNAFSSEKNRDSANVKNEIDGWKWWVHQHEKRFNEMIQDGGLNCKVLWPERMVYGDYAQMYETIEWLGLQWKTDVLTYVDPKLWKSRSKLVSTVINQVA